MASTAPRPADGPAAGPDPDSTAAPPGRRRLRIGIGGMSIESSTFCPHRTTYDDFRITRGAELLDRYTWTAPDGDLAERAEWVPLLHAVSLPGGPVERGTYDRIKDELIERLRRAGPLDGLVYDIHGAMTGFTATSNVAAATAYGIEATGTMAHSYIEAFPDEETAFRAFARTHPNPVTFLVDTYDTATGVATAARVLRELASGPLGAIRLDSGDLGEEAARAREILDAAGLPEVRIVASGGLDEYAVEELIHSGAPIDVYAVGTRMGVSADAASLDTAYKLVAYDGRPVMKLSSAKATAPGSKQVWRRPGFADVIGERDELPPHGGAPLLETVMREGVRTAAPDTLDRARRRFDTDLAGLPPHARRIRHPAPPRPATSAGLARLAGQVRRRIEVRLAAGDEAGGRQAA